MSRKYKTLYLDVENNGYKYEYLLAHALKILRSGPDGRHGENLWWLLMKETIKTAYRNRDKKLFDEARKIFDKHVWNTYCYGMLYDPKILKKYGI